jgi:cytochrome oxidase Cu insertion factor (SCO1/SenC/PrrC family)
MKYYRKTGEALQSVTNIKSKDGYLKPKQLAAMGYLPFATEDEAYAHYGVEKPEPKKEGRSFDRGSITIKPLTDSKIGIEGSFETVKETTEIFIGNEKYDIKNTINKEEATQLIDVLQRFVNSK